LALVRFALAPVLVLVAVPAAFAQPGNGNGPPTFQTLVVNPPSAPIPVTGAVTVSGTSTVTLGNNTPTTPVFVQSVGQPVQTPYQETIHGSCGVNFCTFTFTRPAAGQRLVVQHISASVIAAQGGMVDVEVSVVPPNPTFANIKRVSVNARLQFRAGIIGNNDLFVTNEPILLYVDPSDLTLKADVSFSGNAASLDQYVTLSGYLVSQ
jgi:hypothetical protein